MLHVFVCLLVQKVRQSCCFWVDHFSLFFFASSPWKSVQIYSVERMNFDDYPGLQPNNNTCAKICNTVHKGAFFQFLFRWIPYWHSSKSTGKKTSKTHLFAVYMLLNRRLAHENVWLFLTKGWLAICACEPIFLTLRCGCVRCIFRLAKCNRNFAHF